MAAVEFRGRHESTRIEAGGERKVRWEGPGIAFDAVARQVASAPLGTAIKAQGFLANKSQRSMKSVLHVTNIEFMEGAL